MTDSMKFGPEWLRNLSSDGTTQNPPAPKYQLAEHRYGREEMLALFDRQVKAPDRLVALPALFVEKTQPPLALIQMNEDETRMWNRGINSDAVLRLNPKPASASIPVGRGGAAVGRGGSVDRGRGRARGQGYHYARGLSYEEPGDGGLDGKPGYVRSIGRPFDRAQSLAGGGERGGWGERNGAEPEWIGGTSPRKGLDSNWRRPRGAGEDDDGWRTATASGSTKYVRPSSWREGDKEEAGSGGRWDGARIHRGWDGDSHRHHSETDNLPEWAMENPSESGGSFDASGAFHGGGHSEDDESFPPEVGGSGDRKGLEPRKRRDSPPEPRKRSPPPVVQAPPVVKSQSTPAMATSQSPARHPPEPIPAGINNGDVPNLAHNTGSDSQLSAAANSGKFTPFAAFAANVQNGGPAFTGAHFGPAVSLQEHFNAGRLGANDPSRPPQTSFRKNDADLDRMQEDADILVDKLTADEEEKIHQMAAVVHNQAPPPPPPVHSQEQWFYRDPQSEVQGPFGASAMDDWFGAGYFNESLLVRRACDERFAPLGDLIKAWGRVPFQPGPYMPPLKNDVSAGPSPAPVPLLHRPKAVVAADQEAMIAQQQFQYQQLAARQAQLGHQHAQQTQLKAALGKLAQSEHWPSLSHLEQQQLIMQQMVEHAGFHTPAPPQPAPPKNPVLQNFISQMKPVPGPDPLHQLIQQMGGMGGPMAHPGHHMEPGKMAHPGHMMDPTKMAHPGHHMEPGKMPLGGHHMDAGKLGIGGHPMDASGKIEMDPIQNLLRQINANNVKPQMDVWGNPLTQSWMQPQQMPVAPPPGQLPMSMWDLNPCEMKTEQQILEEQMRAEEEKHVEDAMKKLEAEKRRLAAKEQLQRTEAEKQRLLLKEQLEKSKAERIRLEEEQLRQEEVRRKEEEEKTRLEEQKRLDDELRKKEEKRRKEEDKKKREEEKRRKEEEKERKRKLEEERKIEEEERKRQEEEAARKRAEEEEQTRRVEQQQAAFRRLQQERAKAAPWSQASVPAGSSLAEIQRQEKVLKERETREQQSLLAGLQVAQQAAAAAAAISPPSNAALQLKWADRKPAAARVKSLAEIQAEEAKLSEREKAERAVHQKESVPATAGIWSAAPQSLSWAAAAPVAWGSSAAASGSPVGFWEEVPAAVAAPKPAAAAASRSATKTKAANHSATAAATGKANASPPKLAKSRNKKEEAVVMKLFDHQRGDDFTQWCNNTLQAIDAHVDIPTFVGFLRDIESPYEVKDYVKMYLGEGKEAGEFARQFLERRSKWRSAQRAQPQHDDLAAPAPAVNPGAADFTEVKGKAKKMKKKTMFRVDNRILGFSVTAAQDRINVGDRDYGEGV